MNRPGELHREYLTALETYLEASDETALSQAYELGRRAMIEGLGVLDMATLHQHAVQAFVVRTAAADRAQIADAAANFFNELLSPFEMSFRGYRAANESLRRLNETLQLQKAAVEEANRELESFSYSVSHDLRAPLRTIDGFSQLLVEECADVLDDDRRGYLQAIREAAGHMARLIEDLLALARVTRMEIRRTDVDLSAMARAIVARLQAAADGRTVSVTIQDGVHANGDAGLLGVLLENLMGNAWKFTSKRGQARIAFGREDSRDAAIYFVRDNGAGFDMAHAAKLFAAFQRLHAADEFEGTGIGLATVQRIVQRHGGRVWAEGAVGSGATFFFTLAGERRG